MAGAKCPNCGANLSCGCQRRTASNGASVCTMCQGHYERTLKEKKVVPKKNVTPQPGPATDPSNVQITVTQRVEYL